MAGMTTGSTVKDDVIRWGVDRFSAIPDDPATSK